MTSGAGQFYVLPAGGLAPAELLSSRRMGELLENAKERCDFVLLDAPSFPRVSDALVLAGLVDTVLSVVRLAKTPRKAAVEHVRALSAAGAAQQALVLNDVGESSSDPAASPRRRVAASTEPAPQAARLPRSRSLAWWVAGLLLVVGAVAAAASVSPRAAEVISAAISLRRAS
jgi:Mrp family chromosome partitioning ATPase